MTKPAAQSVVRPPIVVIMGHIDHGKSTLLDFIRKTNVVATEAGGITQHLSAYEVVHKDASGAERRITFLDTPGHAAFQGMRSRGARVADIAILVVSAEDGVKAQTLEAHRAIVAAGIPFIVAINKIDKPNANIERTKQTLAEAEIFLEGWGGNIPWVAISAKMGTGIPELLDTLLLVADLEELRGDPEKPAEGVIIESHVDPRKGISATLVIVDGTMRRGQYIVAEDSMAPIRVIEDFRGAQVSHASFSSPVRITGWTKIPNVGSRAVVVETKKEAEERVVEARTNPIVPREMPMDDGTRIIPLVLKSDTVGTLEAIEHEIGKIQKERVKLKIAGKGVGIVTENDIKLLIGSTRPCVLSFNVGIDNRAAALAEQYDIPVHTFNIIYKLIEWLEEEMKRQTPKQEVMEELGELRILKCFSTQKNRHVVGGRVERGTITVGDSVRIIRREAAIGIGKILGLQQQKIETKEVTEGHECGLMLESDHIPAERDTLLTFRMVER